MHVNSSAKHKFGSIETTTFSDPANLNYFSDNLNNKKTNKTNKPNFNVSKIQ